MDKNNNKLTDSCEVGKILSRFGSDVDPDIVETKAMKLMDNYQNTNREEGRRMIKENEDLIFKFSRMYEFDKHYLLAETVPTRYTAMAVKMIKDMIKENNCNTILEKSLIEIIVNAFCRSLYISANMKASMSGKSIEIDSDIVNYFNFLSKEIDKSNRQYLSALMTLQQMKMPTLKVNLKAETAILAQNQQFNSVQGNNNENNKTN